MLQHNVIIWARSWTWLVRNKLVPLSFLLVKMFWVGEGGCWWWESIGERELVGGGNRVEGLWFCVIIMCSMCFEYLLFFWFNFTFIFGIVTWVLCLVVVFFNVDKMSTSNPPCKGDHGDIGHYQSWWKGSTPKSWTSN
jgi:hypothetical protein